MLCEPPQLSFLCGGFCLPSSKLGIDTGFILCYALRMLARKHLFALFFAVSSLFFAPTWAQDELMDTEEEVSATEEDSADTKKKKGKNKKAKKGKKAAGEEAEEMGAVAAALRELKTLKGKPNLKADYYIYICSASWCGYCRECMPVAVDTYKKIKRSKRVEMILISGDKSDKAAKDYLKSYKAKLPYVMFDEVKNAKFANLPGSSCAIGFPAAAIVNKDGKMISQGVGAGNVKSLLADWKKLTIDNKEAEEAEAAE